MADPMPRERLQPALLDRLADDAPDRKSEPATARVMTKDRLREAVLRDLAWLFNTTKAGDDSHFEGFPLAARSVLNFGLPALSGETASTLDVIELERAIRQAIIDFEPRITPASLQVEVAVSDLQLDHHNVISVRIRGDLWAWPVPLELLLRTDMDLETGQVEIRELGRR